MMSMTPERPEKIKRRADMACTLCRKRKLKCQNTDNEPPCERCKQDPSNCVFVPVAEDPSSRTSSVESTEDPPRRQKPQDAPALSMQISPAFQPRYTLEAGPHQPYPAHQRRPARKAPSSTSGRSPGTEDSSFYRPSEGSTIVEPSPPSWPNSSGQVYARESSTSNYHYQDSTLPSMSAPSTPSYHYSPTPNLAYGQDFHGSDQHPRALHVAHSSPYFSPMTLAQPQEGSHHSPYATNQQPASGIPGYAQSHSSSGPSLDANHYYNQYSR